MELINIGKIIAYFFSVSHLNPHYLLSASKSYHLRDITDNTAPKDSIMRDEEANIK